MHPFTRLSELIEARRRTPDFIKPRCPIYKPAKRPFLRHLIKFADAVMNGILFLVAYCLFMPFTLPLWGWVMLLPVSGDTSRITFPEGKSAS